jgi:hypothetical protein
MNLNESELLLLPTFSFTVHIQSGNQNKYKRAISRLNRGFPSLAVQHDEPQPHIHNLIALPRDKRDWFLETLWQRFEYENRDGLFRELREQDIQCQIDHPARLVAYVLDIRNWTNKNPQIVWGNLPTDPLVRCSGGKTITASQKAVLLPAQQTDTSPLPHRVRKRVPA